MESQVTELLPGATKAKKHKASWLSYLQMIVVSLFLCQIFEKFQALRIISLHSSNPFFLLRGWELVVCHRSCLKLSTEHWECGTDGLKAVAEAAYQITVQELNWQQYLSLKTWLHFMSAKVSRNSSNSLQKGNIITPGSNTYLVKTDGVSLEHLKPFKHC